MSLFQLISKDSLNKQLFDVLAREQQAWLYYCQFKDLLEEDSHLFTQLELETLIVQLKAVKIIDICYVDYLNTLKVELVKMENSNLSEYLIFLKKYQTFVTLDQSDQKSLQLRKTQFIQKVLPHVQISLQQELIKFIKSSLVQDQEDDFLQDWQIKNQTDVQNALQKFKIHTLNELVQLLEYHQVCQDIFLTLSIELIDHVSKSLTVNDTYQPFLGSLQEFTQSTIYEVMAKLPFQKNSENLKKKIDQVIIEIHCERISEKIFDLILYFPETFDIVLEFKQTLHQTQQFEIMENQISQSIKKRLLITGVLTSNILSFYINVLKVLQLVDLHGQIFYNVTIPVKEYLLKRSDCLRCIIQLIANEKYDNLTSEKLVVPQIKDENSSSEDEQVGNLTNKKIKYQEKDLVTILINLYGSQEAFISEYQNMLAEKILGAKELQLDEEIRNIEFMKMRFGETQMQTCNIIVKDIKESKRIDNNVQTSFKSKDQKFLSINQLHPLFLSKTYWPLNYEYKDSFQFSPELESLFIEYSKRYEHLKNMRKLIWHNELGSVNLTLSFDNGDFDFKCLPIHAALIQCFDEEKVNENCVIQSDQLAKDFQMNHEDLKRRMTFWVNRGVIKEIKQQGQKQPLVRQQSYQDNEQDVTFYYPTKVYQSQNECKKNKQTFTKEEDLFLLDELPEDVLVSSQTGQFPNIVQLLSQITYKILQETGAKTQERLFTLLKTIYKSEVNNAITENQLKDAIKLLINSGQVIQTGDIICVS